MDFSRSVEYLLSLGNEVSAMKLGLDNIRTLLAELGNPHEKYLKVQVAGTNGKGSVCAFLDSICNRAGISTGVYTSPHLVSITERIRINGVDISEDEFASLASVVRKTSESLVSAKRIEYTPTFFEQVTAIALLAFAESKVELAILETGLGGRLDATTAANAEIAAITRIDLDHQEYLGETIEEIAAEKAAIIRQDSNVFLTHQSRAVKQVLIGRCREVGVDPAWASTDIKIKKHRDLAPALVGSITTERSSYSNLLLWNMLGRHQFENAALAIAVAEMLGEHGFKLSEDDIVIGIETASYPGRLERFETNILLDGAHNVGGAQALSDHLDEFYRDKPIILVFGMMRDKNVREIVNILWPTVEKIVLTQPSNSRAMSPNELAAVAHDNIDPTRIVKTGTVEEAIEMARSLVSDDGLILITGSLYLVGEAKKLLNNR